jgi:hypothetical protein
VVLGCLDALQEWNDQRPVFEVRPRLGDGGYEAFDGRRLIGNAGQDRHRHHPHLFFVRPNRTADCSGCASSVMIAILFRGR